MLATVRMGISLMVEDMTILGLDMVYPVHMEEVWQFQKYQYTPNHIL